MRAAGLRRPHVRVVGSSALTTLLAAIAACAPAPADEASWLAGRWAVDGESCRTAATILDAGGSWHTQWMSGRWSYSEGRLSRTVTHRHDARRYFDPRGGNPRPVNPPLCHVETVRAIGRDVIETRWADGSTHRMVRCPGSRPPGGVCIGDCGTATPFDFPHAPNPSRPARLCA